MSSKSSHDELAIDERFSPRTNRVAQSQHQYSCSLLGQKEIRDLILTDFGGTGEKDYQE